MGFKLIISLISIFFILILIFFYFVPLNTINFTTQSGNSNFSLLPGNEMQFYSNMRFPESNISYKISDCPLQKQNDMTTAFDIIENITLLRFYPVDNNEEISVTCQEKEKPDETNKLFIAGEGGPTSITEIGNLAVITKGEILLIRESNCPRPNIAIHELLHVLGFQHSTNPQNVMYNITNCDQTIGEDIPQLINQLYSIPSNPDLIFENVSATISGRFLSVNITVMNSGLKKANEFKIQIYSGTDLIKEINMEPINVGYGRFVSINNIWISQIGIKELEFIIDSNFDEISKENNKIKLEIKK